MGANGKTNYKRNKDGFLVVNFDELAADMEGDPYVFYTMFLPYRGEGPKVVCGIAQKVQVNASEDRI